MLLQSEVRADAAGLDYSPRCHHIILRLQCYPDLKHHTGVHGPQDDRPGAWGEGPRFTHSFPFCGEVSNPPQTPMGTAEYTGAFAAFQASTWTLKLQVYFNLSAP